MGYVHPDRSIIKELNDGEQKVVRVLADGLSDSWFIFTRQDLWSAERTYEIDVLLMHEKYGFLALEVKGGPVRIANGEWDRGDERFRVSPVRQVHDAAFELRDQIRETSLLLKHVHIPYAVAFPDVVKLNGQLPPSCTEDMLFLNPVFENIEELVINCINKSGHRQYLSSQKIEEFFTIVLPTVNFGTLRPEGATRRTQ